MISGVSATGFIGMFIYSKRACIRGFFVLVVSLVLTCSITSPSNATEQIALETGLQCQHCHLDPSGGGELTQQGEEYFENLLSTGGVEELSNANKIIRFIAGYIHVLFAVLWFGTILYVHIVLKPSYAEKGLPRGEKRVGVLSFFVVGITGIILTNYRIDSIQNVFDTRFGTLLTIKVALYLTMLASAVVVIKIIGPRLGRSTSKQQVQGQPYNYQTLSNYNGKDGQSCYFAYNGKVYDASNSKMWPNGEHMKRHNSGEDLTEALSLAPHGEDVIHRLPVVGDYDESDSHTRDATTNVFYFVAYMNLVIVFLILLIIALWRWG